MDLVDFAARFGLSVATLRYWKERGLVAGTVTGVVTVLLAGRVYHPR